MRKGACWCALVVLAFVSGCGSEVDEPYTGRYALSEDVVLEVRREGELLTLLPSFWRTAQILDKVAPDTFVSLLHREIQVAFERGSDGRITAVTVSGHSSGEIDGTARRMAPGERLPVEALLAQDANGAIELLEQQGALKTADRAVGLGFRFIRNFPSRAAAGARFLDLAAQATEPTADLYSALGLAWMLADDRVRATAAFRHAEQLDPDDDLAGQILRLIDPDQGSALPASTGQLPFELDELFRPPSGAEVAAVRADWASRDLSPRKVRQVGEHDYETPPAYANGEPLRYRVRIISHDVLGSQHYGAILIPEGSTPGCCGVVIEAHGIDPFYSGFDLDDLETPPILAADARHAVILVPSFRGERLTVDSASYQSEGDPRNGWDGGADDAIALFNAALTVTPEIDPDRVCVYGKSRGGTVALLVGIRDPRVDCVVDWAGPAGWFEHMGTFGFSLREQVQWGLWEG